MDPITPAAPGSPDELGDRMKMYERLWCYGRPEPITLPGAPPSERLTEGLPICVRIDGRAFHTFTAGLPRPYDPRLAALMVSTTRRLVEETNARVGYTQSDEISLVLMQDSGESTPYFGGRVQKMVSMLAAVATSHFNRELPKYLPEKVDLLPLFDARVWNVPNEVEASNVLLWRELDAYKNGVASLARCHFSDTDLNNKGRGDMLQMLADKGVDITVYDRHLLGGTFVARRMMECRFKAPELEALPAKHSARTNPDLVVIRKKLVTLEALPPLIRLSNRVEVLFHGEDPVLADP
jgi:tRNA(His) 5'-end guanylyltransferase